MTFSHNAFFYILVLFLTGAFSFGCNRIDDGGFTASDKNAIQATHAHATVPGGFSSFLGGRGYGTLWETAFDSSGNIIVTGYGDEYTLKNFPSATLIGPAGNRSNITVAKFSPDGKLLWMTIIGGSANNICVGIDVDAFNNIYIAGWTTSADFPTTPKAYDRTYNGGDSDAFVLKLSPDGKSLIYSTFLGGSLNDTARGGLAVDDHGFAYVVGGTGSKDFLNKKGEGNPAKVNDYLGGPADAFITKVSQDGSRIVYSRYLGGSDDTVHGDSALGVQVDANGCAYVNMIVRSKNAFTTPNAFRRTFSGGKSDSYFAKLSPDGKQLLYATYFGGSGDEFAEHRMALDSKGNTYFVGFTNSADFPTINAHQSKKKGPGNGYLVKLDATGQPVFSTYIGGSNNDHSVGPALDGEGNIFVSGETGSTDFEITPSAYNKTYNGGKKDAYLQIYNPSGRLWYSTFLGGSDFDGARGVAVDKWGNPIVVGFTYSSNFPTTANAYTRSYSGGGDGFIVKFDLSHLRAVREAKEKGK